MGRISFWGLRSSPVVALLAGEALQVIDIGAGTHYHLEGRDHLAAGGAVARVSKQSEKERGEISMKINYKTKENI